jgi:predicted nucleic-acid-binding protein
MIAIDTSVLLRYLLADDAKQYGKARSLIESSCPSLITDVVLAEAVWTLAGKRYRLDKEAICAVVRGLVEDAAFRFENSQVVWSALMSYQKSKPIRGKALDFADALIVHKAHNIAERDGLKLQGFYSFDKAVEQLDGAKNL